MRASNLEPNSQSVEPESRKVGLKVSSCTEAETNTATNDGEH